MILGFMQEQWREDSFAEETHKPEDYVNKVIKCEPRLDFGRGVIGIIFESSYNEHPPYGIYNKVAWYEYPSWHPGTFYEWPVQRTSTFWKEPVSHEWAVRHYSSLAEKLEVMSQEEGAKGALSARKAMDLRALIQRDFIEPHLMERNGLQEGQTGIYVVQALDQGGNEIFYEAIQIEDARIPEQEIVYLLMGRHQYGFGAMPKSRSGMMYRVSEIPESAIHMIPKSDIVDTITPNDIKPELLKGDQ